MVIESLGERLRRLRQERDRSQEQVARDLNLSFSIISAYERNERQPPVDKLQMLAKYYDTTVAYLLGESDDPSPTPQPDSGDVGAQLEYFLRGTGRLTERDIKVILRLFDELARANE